MGTGRLAIVEARLRLKGRGTDGHMETQALLGHQTPIGYFALIAGYGLIASLRIIEPTH